MGTALFASTSLFVCLILLFDVDLRALWHTPEVKGKKSTAQPKEEKEEKEKPSRLPDVPERSVRFGHEVEART